MAQHDRAVNVTGLVQGLVIGDHNTVNQNFNVVTREAYVAREYPSAPPAWIERTALTTQATATLTPGAVVALCGMGGSGKTSLAARVAEAAAPRFGAGSFWIDLAAGDIDDALLRMALAFGHDLSLLKSRKARTQTVRSLLAGHAVLIVLDDAASTAELEAFLPLPPSCAALLTTRNDAVASSVATTVIGVDALTTADAVALLATLSGSPSTEPALVQVAESLGCLPLAIELAGKLTRQQARRPGFSWSTFAAGLSDSTRRLSLGLAGATVRAAFDATWSRALDANIQHAFTLLGIFELGNLYTAEVAAAWDANDTKALAHLNALIDLSLLQPVDAVSVRLHPLLADYAHEMAQRLPLQTRSGAHCRVADYCYAHAPSPPVTTSDIAFVLRSHHHAAAAADPDRASRVFPWFKRGNVPVAVPAFLIDHGQHHTLAVHHRLKLDLSQNQPAYSRALALYDVGWALMSAGALAEAEPYLQQSADLLAGPEGDDNARTLSLPKILLALGQAQAQLGRLDAAEATFRRAADIDRQSDAAGDMIGALAGALIALLQLADLLAQSNRSDGKDQAQRICQEVYTEATQRAETRVAVMALARLAGHVEQAEPAKSLQFIRAARQLLNANPDTFAGRDAARYARLIAETARSLTFNGEPALDDTLALFCIAINTAGRSEAWQELGYTLYQLGNLFEHYHLLDRDAPLPAAWACYHLCETYTKESETGSALNAQARIDTRIVPRIETAQRSTAAAAVAADPWGTIAAALAPHPLAWRPTL